MGRRETWVALATVIAALWLAGCGGPSGPGPLPQPSPPQITCATGVTVSNVTAPVQAVSFTAPTVTGGAAPVSVSCSPASGSEFPLGDSPVTCIASDAQGRQATCSFTVAVRHRTFALTRYLAFGDSMTEGENGRPINFIPIIDIANAYPTFLQGLFAARMPGQAITVVNAGRGGERITQNDERLKGAIAAAQAQVLLFLEGANDILGNESASKIAGAVEDSIRTARSRGVEYVFVSTLLPTAPENCVNQPGAPRCRGDVAPGLIQETNGLIRQLVPGSGAHLVDPYAEFLANRSSYIDIDGLHLRPAGNQALATAFWNRMLAVIPPQQLGLH
jgi:lysophospholipase L1-like esterase